MKYTLALDDFVFEPKYAPLVQMADIIKVDLTLTPVEQTLELIERCGERIRFLAEKVETQAEFEAAAGAGYTLFQGYFFAKPEIVEARDIPACQQNYLLLLREVSQSKLNIESVERIMRSEPSLSMKLLRYINSAAFGIRNKVESIRQAVLLLGDRMFRKWSSLVAVTCLSEGAGPDELMRNCLTRAEFCDRISAELHMEKRAFDLFLFGLLSGLEAIMRTPLERIIADLPLSEDIRAALLGQGEGQIRDVFELCIALERVDVTSSELLMQRLSLSEDTARQAYEAAVRFADEAMGV
jgi:EAL and modified HD-GYP domain-containing signal transduction protein